MTPGESPKHAKGQPGIVQAALSGLCPRCGEPTLFEAPARVALTCSACQLDLAALERAGRFAGLLTVALAAILATLTILADIAFQPPFWLQLAFWAPVTVGAVIFALRLYKTALLYARYEKQGTGQ